MGTVNPVGSDVNETWSNMLNGRSGIGPIRSFDPDDWELQCRIAGEVDPFDPEALLGKRKARHLDRFSQFALVAAREAVAQAGLVLEGDDRYRVATSIASGSGGLTTTLTQEQILRERGARRVSPFTVPMLMPNAAAGVVSIELGSWGPCFATASACASAADAIGIALDMIRAGRADAVIAGGSEAAIQPLSIASFDRAQALCRTFNDDPERASRPFDLDRSGFVLSEGAAILILESEDHARARGAPILAELAGYGAGADGFHLTAPEPEGRGAHTAMRVALDDAGADPDEVVYINAHGTSTQLNDRIESLAIERVFGAAAGAIPISSTKSMSGHLAGASGALEAVVCTRVAATGWAPPTINLDTPDPACSLDYTPWEARRVRKGLILSNSFGFGGHSSCLAFRGYDR
jgi:3-oxoacyl-[acyl-carrier-protein] synthase II